MTLNINNDHQPHTLKKLSLICCTYQLISIRCRCSVVALPLHCRFCRIQFESNHQVSPRGVSAKCMPYYLYLARIQFFAWFFVCISTQRTNSGAYDKRSKQIFTLSQWCPKIKDTKISTINQHHHQGLFTPHPPQKDSNNSDNGIRR